MWHMKTQGYAKGTIKSTSKILKAISKRVNLDNPEMVKAYIADIPGKSGYKWIMTKSYGRYVKFYGLSWEEPKYKRVNELPYIPTEKQVDAIIAGSCRRYKLIFRLLKECGFRPIELHELTLRNIDLERGVIRVTSAKHGNPRAVKLKPGTLAMLKEYVGRGFKLNGRLFPTPTAQMQAWIKTRNRLAEELHRPELRKIRLYDLRHYFATMLYHKTKDILYVKQQMGHRSIKSTMVYVNLINFEADEWISQVATTVEEACKLIDAGFEFVCDFEGKKIFRKRK